MIRDSFMDYTSFAAKGWAVGCARQISNIYIYTLNVDCMMIRVQCWITSLCGAFRVQQFEGVAGEAPLTVAGSVQDGWSFHWSCVKSAKQSHFMPCSFVLLDSFRIWARLKFSQYEFLICQESCRLSISWRSSIHLTPWCVRRNWQHIVSKSSSEMSLSAADSGAHAFGDLPIEGAKVGDLNLGYQKVTWKKLVGKIKFQLI